MGCCKEIYRSTYTYYLFLYTPLVLALFCSSIPTSLIILNMFFSCIIFIILILFNIANVQRTFEIVKKIEIMLTWQYN